MRLRVFVTLGIGATAVSLWLWVAVSAGQIVCNVVTGALIIAQDGKIHS